MPETEMPPHVFQLMIFLSLILLLLGIQVIVCVRIGGRIKQLGNRLDGISKNPVSHENEPSHAETSAGGAFEAFLGEDAARRAMPKAEQFSAYRKWRQEKGMNWSNS